MADSDIESYFGSYARKSPVRLNFCQELGITPEEGDLPQWKGLDISGYKDSRGNPRLIEVAPDNYPKLYEALTEECAFRGISRPACYIDTEAPGKFPLAYANSGLEAIFFTPELYERMNKQELRAVVAHEVKHLYSGIAKDNSEMRKIENDCDRASVESTDYATVQSYVHKAMTLMVDKKIPIPVFRNFIHRVHETFPNAIAENFWIPLDNKHPSPAARMENMREHERKITRQNQFER